MAGDFWSQLTQLRSWNPLDYLRQGQQSKYTLMTENEKQQARNLLQTIASGMVPPAAQAEYQQMKADPQQYLQTTVRQPPTQEAQAGIIQNLAGAMPLAFHGSPHKFEKFDISKVGTGQGAQSYGHGLYFAENPEVAKTYQAQDAVVINKRTGKIAQNLSANELADVGTPASKYDWESAGGQMYKVNIPDEHVAKMLDWDKPLSEQPREIVSKLEKYAEANPNSPLADALQPIERKSTTGSTIYRSLFRYAWDTPKERKPEEVSQVLQQLGIPGIKYLDQGSRSIGQGTRNFVVFDPSVLEGPLP